MNETRKMITIRLDVSVIAAEGASSEEIRDHINAIFAYEDWMFLIDVSDIQEREDAQEP